MSIRIDDAAQVRFSIPDSMLEQPGMRQLLKDVFALSDDEMTPRYRGGKYNGACVNIVSTPGQFAAFIILRHDRGMDNLIKALRPELLGVELPADEVDVTARPTRIRLPAGRRAS